MRPAAFTRRAVASGTQPRCATSCCGIRPRSDGSSGMATRPPNNPLRNPLARSTPEAQAKWEKHERAVARIYHEYRIAVISLGEDEALWHWKKAPAKRGPGRPRGSPNPERDVELLTYYDVLVKEDPSLDPAKIGRMVDQAFPHEYGATEGGVTAKLRRLLKLRSKIQRPNRLLPPDWRDK